MRAIVFHPRPERTQPARSAAVQVLDVPVEPGVTVGGRFYAAGRDGPTILFFHGNGGTLRLYAHLLAEPARARGLAIAFPAWGLGIYADESAVPLLERATAFRNANTHEPATYDEFKQVVEKGWAYVWFAGGREEEARIKEETKATVRCIPLEQPGGSGTCFYTGKPATQKVIFARSY